MDSTVRSKDRRRTRQEGQDALCRADSAYLNKANCVAQADRVVQYQFKSSQADSVGFEAIILDSIPNALPAGRFVEDDGWTFRWERGHCVLTSPTGTRKLTR